MSLPDDLVREEILSKLATSIKSAARLCCVCKSWREWIRHPDFLKPHPVMVICKPGGDLYAEFHGDYQILTHHSDIVYPLNLPQGLRLKVIGECYGILCIGNLDDPARLDHLYNPITSEHRTLPPPGLLCSSSGYHRHGFGFSKRENDYKIIRFWKMGSTRTAMAEIYKLSTNCWSNLNVDLGFIHDTSDFSNVSIYMNGTCYWLYDIYSPKPNRVSIVSFDLQTETFGHITNITPMAPSSDGERVTTPDLGMLDDSLALCVHKVYHDFTEVWVMPKYRNMESNWTKIFTIKSCCLSSTCWIHNAELFQLDSSRGEVLTYLTDEQGGEAENARTRVFIKQMTAIAEVWFLNLV